MFDKYFQEMKKIGIIFSSGLDNNEIKKVETLYNIKFPNIYKQFLQKIYLFLMGFIIGEIFQKKIFQIFMKLSIDQKKCYRHFGMK